MDALPVLYAVLSLLGLQFSVGAIRFDQRQRTNLPGPVSETQPDVVFPFQNTSLTWEDRVDDLVSRLSLEEIVPQTWASYHKPTPAIPRLGIKPYVWITECLRGQMRTDTTAFPQALGLASSFRYFIN